MSDSNFRKDIEKLVAKIPEGRVMTYGQLAALAGKPTAPRIVGGIAHYGDPNLPWHRVVNKQGGLASGYPGGRIAHKQLLESEKVVFNDRDQLDIEGYIWWPK